MSTQRLAALILSALPLLGAACAMDLPFEERIAGIRPLALRGEVQGSDADPEASVRAEGLPSEVVRMIPFVADDDGPLALDDIATRLEPRWIACNLPPEVSLGTCLASSAPLSPTDVPPCPETDLETLDPVTGTFAEVPSPCEVVGGTAAQPEYAIPFEFTFLLGGDVELTMVAHDPDSPSGDTEVCYAELLQGGTSAPEDCLYVTQRIPVGPDGTLTELAAELGITEGLEPVPDPIPDPDSHPRIQTLIVREVDGNGSQVAVFEPARGAVLPVTVGHQLEMETLAPEADLQTYAVTQGDGSFSETEEAYEGRWFITWGSLLSPQSDDPRSFNTWTLERGSQDAEEDDRPPGNRATLYYVLRDGRQGVDWWWFHVDVEP